MRNKKGFTLIEIIVSLLIASIAMVIATTMILNSMGYFTKTAVSDHDKQALDAIKDYFQNELIYATEARISVEKPDSSDWHWLYVKNGVLYRDDNYGYDDSVILEDIVVYTDDFYNSRTLEVVARTFGEYRIDLKFSFLDSSETVYKTSTTIEMLNFSKNISGGVSSVKDNSQELSDGYKIYYKKGALNYEKSNTQKYNGTVADQTECLLSSDLNNEDKKYDKNNENNYITGDIVYFLDDNKEKVWYVCLEGGNYSTDTDITNNSSFRWKKLDEKFDSGSGYLVGDIVKYVDKNGEIYFIECINDLLNNGVFGVDYDPLTKPNFWKIVSESEVRGKSNKKCGLTSTKDLPKDTVYKSLDEVKYNAQLYDVNKVFTKNTVITMGNLYNPINSEIWKKITNDNLPGSKPGESFNQNYVWRDYSLDWKSYNGYMKGDIIRYNDETYTNNRKFNDNLEDHYYKAKNDIIDGKPPTDTRGKVSENWVEVVRKNDKWSEVK